MSEQPAETAAMDEVFDGDEWSGEPVPEDDHDLEVGSFANADPEDVALDSEGGA